MLPSDLTLSALRFILSAKSRQSCKQDCETVDFCNSLPCQRKQNPTIVSVQWWGFPMFSTYLWLATL